MGFTSAPTGPTLPVEPLGQLGRRHVGKRQLARVCHGRCDLHADQAVQPPLFEEIFESSSVGGQVQRPWPLTSVRHQPLRAKQDRSGDVRSARVRPHGP